MRATLDILDGAESHMTYDNWKAEEPMTDRGPRRDFNDVDFDIAIESLGDTVEAMSTFDYAFGNSVTEREMIAEMLTGLLARLIEENERASMPKRTLALRQLNTAIEEFASGEKS
jgi:hypothetical protein